MKRVLILEDDDVVQQFMVKILKMLGAEPVVAGNPQKAEEALSNLENIDLAIVDLILPFITGWDVIDRIRKSGPAVKNLPIVVLTGAAVSEKEKAKLLAKVDAVVWKGDFALDEFVGILKRWL